MTLPDKEKSLTTEKVVHEFTYIGKGPDSPYEINFMGKQVFQRGKLTEVTDPDVLAKLYPVDEDGRSNVTTFVKGTVKQEVLHENDKQAQDNFKKIVDENAVLDARFKRKHAGA
jgi:hypothetical protein